MKFFLSFTLPRCVFQNFSAGPSLSSSGLALGGRWGRRGGAFFLSLSLFLSALALSLMLPTSPSLGAAQEGDLAPETCSGVLRASGKTQPQKPSFLSVFNRFLESKQSFSARDIGTLKMEILGRIIFGDRRGGGGSLIHRDSSFSMILFEEILSLADSFRADFFNNGNDVHREMRQYLEWNQVDRAEEVLQRGRDALYAGVSQEIALRVIKRIEEGAAKEVQTRGLPIKVKGTFSRYQKIMRESYPEPADLRGSISQIILDYLKNFPLPVFSISSQEIYGYLYRNKDETNLQFHQVERLDKLLMDMREISRRRRGLLEIIPLGAIDPSIGYFKRLLWKYSLKRQLRDVESRMRNFVATGDVLFLNVNESENESE